MLYYVNIRYIVAKKKGGNTNMAEEKKLEVIEGTKMEIMLPQANRAEAEEVAEFLESLTMAQKQRFMDLVDDMKLAMKLLA
jgi:hypothetical protein